MIKLLRQSFVALFVLALALIAQIPHAAYVFDNITGPLAKGEWTLLGFSYAIALELAVLMFVVHGKQAESYAFAFASVLVNLSYYAMHSVQLWSLAAFPAWLIAFMLPVAIARYSHVIAEVEGTQDKPLQVPARLQIAFTWLRVQVATLPFAQALQASEDANTIDVQPMQEVQEVAQPKQLQDSPTMQASDLRKWAQDMRNSNKTLGEIATQVGKSESWVSRNTQAIAS